MVCRRIAAGASGLALMVMLGLGAVLPTTVHAAPDLSQLCTAIDDFGIATHGACVSTLQTVFNNGNTEAVGFCKVLGNLGARNQGECVSTARRFGF